ncbi:MAG: WG repeat-containing protein, partial [Bacteroidetes bacterium]
MKTISYLLLLLVSCTYFTPLKSQDLFPKKVKRHYVYVDEAGNQPFKIKFKDAMGFREGLAAVAIKDKWGFINEKGEVVI